MLSNCFIPVQKMLALEVSSPDYIFTQILEALYKVVTAARPASPVAPHEYDLGSSTSSTVPILNSQNLRMTAGRVEPVEGIHSTTMGFP